MTKKGFIYYISDYYNGDLGKILDFAENTTFANQALLVRKVYHKKPHTTFT